MSARRTGAIRHVGERCSTTDVHASWPFRGTAIRRLMPARRRWRRMTARLRALPDFVIVGAQKAGTTSLYGFLAAHPDVVRAAAKEVHFFDTCDWRKGILGYRANFPVRAHLWLRSRLSGRPVITGEASPYYLYHPLAAERLAATVPHAKVIILLRDPVERTISHYFHEVRIGREHLSLQEALAAEEVRLRGRERALAAGEPQCRHLDHQHFSYMDRSRYARQVQRYLALFPPEHVLVLKSERLFGDDPTAKARVAEFLGIRPLTGDFVAENVGGPRRRDPDEARIRRNLAGALAAEEEALAGLLGDEFRWPRDRSTSVVAG